MLNLNEYNESLYKALDKKNRKKNMVENYGQFLMHAKKTSGVTNLPDKTWLTDEVRGAISEAYKVLNKKSMQVNESNDPSAIYDACRGEISVLAKLIRKANAGGLDSSYITQLNNYRNELESRAEEARSAMSRENQSSKVARHSEEAGEALEHGEKWNDILEYVESKKNANELMHHGVKGQEWGHRRYQNADGSLTPEGRAHYGYGADGKQSKEGKKLQKYADKQHKIYDKYSAKREAALDRSVEKYRKKYEKDPSDKNRGKYVEALQRRIANDEIAKHMHNKIDDLTMENYKDDRAIGTKSIAKASLLPFGKFVLYKAAGEAAKKGAYGPVGGLHDIAKYNARMTDEEYAKISEKSRDAAIKRYLEETNPGKKVNVTVLDGSKQDSSKNAANTITDMTLKGANDSEISKAVKSSTKKDYMSDPDNFRNGNDYNNEQKRLKSLSDSDFQKELDDVGSIKKTKSVPENAAYWEKYTQGTPEYNKAQREANLAEKKVYKADDMYTAAIEKYGKDSPQAEAAKKKYQRAYADFEHEYGYSPQEFD